MRFPESGFALFSQMRSSRVPVLRLGSRGPGGDARSLRLCPPSVRKRSQAFAEGRTCRNCRHFWTRLVSSRLESVNSHRDRGGPGRETQNCLFASQKCQQSQGSGGSWSRNAELSSLFDSPRVFASQKCQQSQGSGGVLVAKRRTVVTFGLASGERQGERREEKRYMRGERQEERREEREERREKRGEERRGEERRGEERRGEERRGEERVEGR